MTIDSTRPPEDTPRPANTAEPFHRVSPKLVRVRLVLMAAVMVPLLLVGVVLGVLSGASAAMLGLLGATWGAVLVWLAALIARQVPAMGYQCRADDLVLERGIMLRRSTLVPYGRMQFVEVTQGPIARWFGLASVELHTAAALSQASIDGLPRAEAEALRDLLATRAEADLAGL